VGVASIVRFGNDYAVVPDEVIEKLRQRADPDTGLHRLGSQTPFAPGSTVRIVAGAFDGLEGVFQRESGDERVVVLLTVLGRSTPVRIPAAFVLAQSVSRATLISLRQVHHAHR
jgi:transcriptional antiterminator RfaH